MYIPSCTAHIPLVTRYHLAGQIVLTRMPSHPIQLNSHAIVVKPPAQITCLTEGRKSSVTTFLAYSSTSMNLPVLNILRPSIHSLTGWYKLSSGSLVGGAFSNKGLHTLPVLTVTTRTPRGASSVRIVPPNASIAAFEALYMPKNVGRKTWFTLPMLATREQLCWRWLSCAFAAAIKRGKKALVTANTPSTLTSNNCCAAVTSVSANGITCITPALLINMSSFPPVALDTWVTAALIEELDVTSRTSVSIWRSFKDVSRSADRPEAKTRWPRRWNSVASALPIPAGPQPVIRTVLGIWLGIRSSDWNLWSTWSPFGSNGGWGDEGVRRRNVSGESRLIYWGGFKANVETTSIEESMCPKYLNTGQSLLAVYNPGW